jgi:sugar phosphate isomerase/epimerase
MHSSGAELAALLAELKSPVFAAVWDPGNSLLGGSDSDPVANGYPAIAPYIGHVHIKDPYQYADGSRVYVAVGSGLLGIERQIRLLAADGYRGYVSLETHWRPDRVMSQAELDFPGGETFSASGYAATKADLERLRHMVESALAPDANNIGLAR